MKPKIERKSFGIAEFKMLDEGNGGMECVPSVFGDIDSYGDIILNGAYAGTLEHFDKRGFVAHSHDWTYNGVIGYPENCHEDDYGLRVRMAFHGDEGSQSVRQKAKERMAAGKEVLLSIGFVTEDSETVYPNAYDKRIPEAIGEQRWLAIKSRATAFSKIRLVKQIKLYEFSLVTVPALDSAAATDVRSAEVEVKSKHLGKYAEAYAGIEAVYCLMSELAWGPLRDSFFETDSDIESSLTMMGEACDEFRDLTLRVVRTMREAMAASDSPEEMQAIESKAVEELFADPSITGHAGGARGMTLVKKIAAVVSAAEAKSEFRASEGRALSKEQRVALRDLKERIEALTGEPECAETASAASAEQTFEQRKLAAMAEYHRLAGL